MRKQIILPAQGTVVDLGACTMQQKIVSLGIPRLYIEYTYIECLYIDRDYIDYC